ncbi:MAG TPA: hypothetical protein VL099_07350 [Candidatus Binatia bacterium]|nr:hypothetical protein [Candidatus Binatia bacterium]
MSPRSAARARKAARRKPPRPQPPPPQPAQPQPCERKRALWRMRNPKSLVRAIFAAKDPVEVGTNLLNGAGDATVAKSFFNFWEILFDQQDKKLAGDGQEAGSAGFQFMSNVPRPQRSIDPDSQDQQDKEMCLRSLSGAAGAAPSLSGISHQENKND